MVMDRMMLTTFYTVMEIKYVQVFSEEERIKCMSQREYFSE